VTWRALLWWRPPCLLHRVIVNLKADRDVALRGVLFGSRGAWLTLRDVTALRTSGPPAKVDGEVCVHRSNVSFIQVLTDGDHS
jgi:hypothetical protein